MKKTFLILFVLFTASTPLAHGFQITDDKLSQQYEIHRLAPSDINEHIPVLRQLARECSSVVELGVRNMVSTWGMLKGLSENPNTPRFYLGIDLMYPPPEKLRMAQEIARVHAITFEFWQASDMDIDIDPVDLLFIDTLHTYCHLTYELEKFSPQIHKYIVMHDTSAPWGDTDDYGYHGNYSEYPAHIDRNKRGLWPAVVDFLERHPEWTLHDRRLNNHGLTILKRNVKVSQEDLPQPYNTVNILPFDSQGWFTNGPQLEVLIKKHRVKIAVEVGCWIGASTRFIAQFLPKGGKVYAVDHWLGSSEHQPGQPAHLPVLPVIYEQFLSNVIHTGLTDKIIPIRMSSLEAANYLCSLNPPVCPDLIYIDASHDTESVYADLNAWYPFLSKHGILCGDDWFWPPIRAAVEKFAGKHNLLIEASGSFWCLSQPAKVYPIQLAIPESKIVDHIPLKDKDFADLVPGDFSTYVYTEESDYYNDYQRSYFAFTWKKDGWDCMRHYEILANGCIPYFVDLEKCDPRTMYFLPKELILEAMRLEGVSYGKIDHTVFDKAKYDEILSKLLEHTRQYLTTKNMASYILETINYKGTGKILFLSNGTKPDYMRCCLLIGLKQLLKELLIDYPKIPHIYESYSEDIHQLYGKGMSYTKIIEDIPIDRENLEQRIANREFDLIIYGSVHRGLRFHDLVQQVYSPDEIIYICGEDAHQCDRGTYRHFFLRESESLHDFKQLYIISF